MIHSHKDVEGEITVTLAAEDWVWFCELLAEVVNDPLIDQCTFDDTVHALTTLQAFEAGV